MKKWGFVGGEDEVKFQPLGEGTEVLHRVFIEFSYLMGSPMFFLLRGEEVRASRVGASDSSPE